MVLRVAFFVVQKGLEDVVGVLFSKKSPGISVNPAGKVVKGSWVLVSPRETRIEILLRANLVELSYLGISWMWMCWVSSGTEDVEENKQRNKKEGTSNGLATKDLVEFKLNLQGIFSLM